MQNTQVRIKRGGSLQDPPDTLSEAPEIHLINTPLVPFRGARWQIFFCSLVKFWRYYGCVVRNISSCKMQFWIYVNVFVLLRLV